MYMPLLAIVFLFFFTPPVSSRMSSETNNFAPGFVSDLDADYLVEDMDGDGKADIVRVNCDKGYIAIGFSLGAGKNLKPSSVTGWVSNQSFHPYDVRSGVCNPGEKIEIADLDGNGAGDLLIYSFDPKGPGAGNGGKLEGRLAVVEKVEGASNPNANTNAFWYEHPASGVNYAWTHAFQGPPSWMYTHKGFSARFPLIPELPGEVVRRTNIIRHGDVSCDDKPDLVRFNLSTGDVIVHVDRTTGPGLGCAFTGTVGPNAPAQCDFHTAGQKWLYDFAYDNDEPHVGRLFHLAGGGTVSGILNFNRFDNSVYTTVSTCSYFEPLGQWGPGFMASNPRPVFGHTKDAKLGHDGGRFIGEATHLFLEDMNHDGFDDIVSFDLDAQGRRNMWVALNDRFGNFGTWDAKPFVPILWMSEPPNQDPKDNRKRHFGLGDVDGDEYIDYVMFPDTSLQPLARARFQIVNYLAIFESSSLRDLTMQNDVPDSYKEEFLNTKYFPKITHDYPTGTGRYQGLGVKDVVDPFVSFDNEGIGWARNPYSHKSGAAFYLYDFIGGVGQCPTSSGIPQHWEDRNGLTDLEQDVMFTCALSNNFRLTPKQFTDVSKLEQTKHGIFHHNFQAMIATTRESGDCDGWPEAWWYVGRMFRSGSKNHPEGREAFALFMHSIRHCTEQTETDARIMAHEYGHALNLQHDDAYNFRPAKVNIPELEWWFTRNNNGLNRTIMRTKSYDEGKYSFWFSPTSALHLAGQKPDLSSSKLICEDADARVHGTWYTGHINGPTRWGEFVCKTPLATGQSCNPQDLIWLRLQRHREHWKVFWK